MNDRMKWCRHCGREKPISDFYRGGKGGIQGRCKRCHRYFSRASFRARYRNDPAFAAAQRARSRARWHARRAA